MIIENYPTSTPLFSPAASISLTIEVGVNLDSLSFDSARVGIQRAERSIALTTGLNYTISCNRDTSTFSAETSVWFRDGVQVATSPSQTICADLQGNSWKLFLKNFSVSNVGRYWCAAFGEELRLVISTGKLEKGRVLVLGVPFHCALAILMLLLVSLPFWEGESGWYFSHMLRQKHYAVSQAH